MYAVIKTGGKQYRVQVGDTVFVEKLDAEAEAAVTFDEVLAVGGEGELRREHPFSRAPESAARFLLRQRARR